MISARPIARLAKQFHPTSIRKMVRNTIKEVRRAYAILSGLVQERAAYDAMVATRRRQRAQRADSSGFWSSRLSCKHLWRLRHAHQQPSSPAAAPTPAATPPDHHRSKRASTAPTRKCRSPPTSPAPPAGAAGADPGTPRCPRPNCKRQRRVRPMCATFLGSMVNVQTTLPHLQGKGETITHHPATPADIGPAPSCARRRSFPVNIPDSAPL